MKARVLPKIFARRLSLTAVCLLPLAAGCHRHPKEPLVKGDAMGGTAAMAADVDKGGMKASGGTGATEAGLGGAGATSGASDGGREGQESTSPFLASCEDELGLGPAQVLLKPYSEQPAFASYEPADVNGDGRLDWVIVTSDSVSVRLHEANGSFLAPLTSVLDVGDPSSLTTGDLNEDGLLDVAVVVYQESKLRLFWGDGLGGFAFGGEYGLGRSPTQVAAVDLDADGHQDLVVPNLDDNTLLILFGQGNGAFGTSKKLSVAGNPIAVAFGDFDSDGQLDIVASSLNRGTVTIFAGRGEREFQRRGEYTAGALPSVGPVVDLNDDGALDLVVANGCTPSDEPAINVLLGEGDGSFRAPTRYPTRDCVTGLTAADLDGDDVIDILGPTGPLFGLGDGTFEAEESVLGGGHPFGLDDWDGDGVLDVALLNQGYGDWVSLVHGNGDGTFGGSVSSTLEVAGAPSQILATDIDGDTRADLALLLGDSLVIANGAGDGTFSLGARVSTGGAPASFVVSDFDGDGLVDFAISDRATPGLTVLLADGEGSFDSSALVLAGTAVTSVPVVRWMSAIDLNGDKHTDLLLLTEDSHILFLRGQGDGTFLQADNVSLTSNVFGLLLVDANGDGKLDVATQEGSDGSNLLLGRGNGSFEPAIRWLPQQAAASGDFDEDGVLDLFVHSDLSLGVVLGRANGTFGPEMGVLPLGWEGRVLDVDGDGHQDIVAGDAIVRGTGDGTFSCVSHAPLGQGTLVDVNGDDLLDNVEVASLGDSIRLRILLHAP